MNKSRFALFNFPFRLFFLLTGLYGVVTVGAWMSYLFGGLALPLGWSSVHWHAHEMLFGLTSAAIAGFLLTAMCNWTGVPPLHGGALLGLACLWLAGRVMMWTASWWPAGWVAVVDLLFLPWMAIYVARVLLAHGNKRNLIMVAILLLLTLANGMMHAGFMTGSGFWLTLGQLTAFNLITLMMVVIGGRIIPLFTINWLRNTGGDIAAVAPSARLDRVALITTALLVPADWLMGFPWITGFLAAVAGVLHGARLATWGGWKTGREPLLWILHLGYVWIVVALLLKGAAAFNLVAASVWQHALGVGAMGTLILGIMTRVALGHTGRSLALPPFGVLIYLAITLGALSRVLTAVHVMDYRVGLSIAAIGWTLAFSLFVLIYWPILSRPRADGRPG